jgi:hypothetical protein
VKGSARRSNRANRSAGSGTDRCWSRTPQATVGAGLTDTELAQLRTLAERLRAGARPDLHAAE